MKRNSLTDDVEDVIFLNNWIISMIPEVSHESTFFYVWLTKPENLLKFLREFKITVNPTKVDAHPKKIMHHQSEQSNFFDKSSKLTAIL
jgi:hypothetical protein